MDLKFVRKMSDRELLIRVQHLAREERHATTTLVAHLSEMERRKLHLDQGCRSLFTYCTEKLHLSEHAAYNRIEAARIALRFPAVLTHLAAGDVHLTAVRVLAPCLTVENHHELLAAAKHKSKREVEEIVARLQPRPDAASSVRKLPGSTARQAVEGHGANSTSPGQSLFEGAAAAGTAMAAAPETASRDGMVVAETTSPARGAEETALPAGAAANGTATNSSTRAPRRTATIVPLAPERYKVQFTASATTHANLRKAQELLRHRIPEGDIGAVIDTALELLVRDLEKRKFAAVGHAREPRSQAGDTPQSSASGRAGGPQQPRRRPASAVSSASTTGTAASRHIPAMVKRAVWQRDKGRCAFIGADGLRCTERGQLEFDHIHPYADGGAPSIDNLRLLCRQHNQHEAGSFFGTWQADADYSFQNESHLELAPGQPRTG